MAPLYGSDVQIEGLNKQYVRTAVATLFRNGNKLMHFFI